MMLRSAHRVLALTIAFLASTAVRATAQTTAASPAHAAVVDGWRIPAGDVASLDSARALLAAWRAGHGIPGISAAIAVDGRLLWTGGFGLAQVQNAVPATAETLYRIGSISKPISAVVALQLVQQHRLDLDVPIRRYLPDLPAPLGALTMRQLMSHTAGVRHYRGDEFLSDVAYPDVKSSLSIFENDSLLFAPGTKFSYSTYGYVLASAVTVAAAGVPYTRLVRDSIIDRLGLTGLTAEHKGVILPHQASFYTRRALERITERGRPVGRDGELVNAPEVDLSNKWAGGGYDSTPADLVRFALALLDGRLLRPATVDSMFTPQRANDGKPVVYGLGWFVGKDGAGRRVIQHTGGSMGATSVLLFYPDQKLVVSIIGNVNGVGYVRPAEAIARVFLGER